MISVEYLADLLNKEFNDDIIKHIKDLWEDDIPAFDPDHPEIGTALEKICDAINEEIEIEDFE